MFSRALALLLLSSILQGAAPLRLPLTRGPRFSRTLTKSLPTAAEPLLLSTEKELPVEEVAAEGAVASNGRKGPAPKLAVEGDSLEATWWQHALLGGVWVTTAMLFVGVVKAIHSPVDAAVILGTFAYSVVFADFFSGFFHWVVDNYGGLETPIFGTVIAAFQGHHDAPWTITYRPFSNNVYKICYAALPGCLLTLLAQQFFALSPVLVVFLAVYFNGQILAQEFHKYSHMTTVPPLVSRLQDVGVMLSKKEHGLHHLSPYKGRYSILNGISNKFLDNFGVWRRLELLVYRLSGQEPNTWKFEPELKARTLRKEFRPMNDMIHTCQRDARY